MVTATAPSEAPMDLPWSLWDVQRALAERSLWEFVKQAWPVVEPDLLVPGWHIQAVCGHLEAVSRKQIRNLIINIPPRHTKSLITSVFWPAWEWGPFNRPQTRWLCMSYAGDLSIRDSVKCRTLVQSQWYRERWGDRYLLQGDQNAKERYNNNRGGVRVASSVGGVGTGEGGDRLVVDDANSVKEVTSAVARKSVNDWWDSVMPTRINNPKSGAKVIIAQRSHHDDLVGHIKETTSENYEWLVLPAEFEASTHCRTSIGFTDPRTQEGELLWPVRYGPKELADLKKELGGYAYAAQFQQRPSPMEGGILKRHWWQFYSQFPADLEMIFQSWDLAFKGLHTSDYVCGQVWGIKGAGRYLLDEIYARLDFVQTIQAIRTLTARWPKAVLKVIEDKANGPAVISALRNEISGIVAENPEGSKESRVFAVSPEVEAGNVYLPNPMLCPWVSEWIENLAGFPNAPHDDRVDAFTQAMLRARRMKRATTFAPVIGTAKQGWSMDV